MLYKSEQIVIKKFKIEENLDNQFIEIGIDELKKDLPQSYHIRENTIEYKIVNDKFIVTFEIYSYNIPKDYNGEHF